jgi:membrane associated rhomboid family serine protease
MVFQVLTWIFLHGNLSHLLFNSLGIWMFGSLLEETWGTKQFTKFVFLSGAITGVLVALFSLIDPMSYSAPTIGASGIVFAILIAVSRMFPNQVVLFFFVFPMRMRYFAYLMIVIEFYALYSSNQGGVSNIAHLSGAAVGFFLSRGPGPGAGVNNWLKDFQDRWHQRRMRKKLRVVRSDQKITYH